MLSQQGLIASFRVKGPGEDISEPRRSWSPNPGVGDLAIANKQYQIRMGEKREPAHPSPSTLTTPPAFWLPVRAEASRKRPGMLGPWTSLEGSNRRKWRSREWGQQAETSRAVYGPLRMLQEE